MAKKFSELKEPTREQVVRKLMEEGGSNGSVAESLGTKPNTIAGYRHRKGIPSTHKPPFKPKGVKVEKRSSVVSDTEQPRIERRKFKIASSEAMQCIATTDEEGHKCVYEREPNSDYCALPHHQTLEKKKPARR